MVAIYVNKLSSLTPVTFKPFQGSTPDTHPQVSLIIFYRSTHQSKGTGVFGLNPELSTEEEAKLPNAAAAAIDAAPMAPPASFSPSCEPYDSLPSHRCITCR